MHFFKGFTNNSCEFYPCHKNVKREFNCLFCYCPLITKECPGPYKVLNGKYGITKDCFDCSLNHDGIEQSWKFIQKWLAVSPPWNQEEQSIEKIKKYSNLVKEKYDLKDIEWAENNK